MANLPSKSQLSPKEIGFLVQAAIETAMENNWQEAAKINLKILLCQKDDVEALNRLARAYVCLGENQKAEKAYKKVLELDPYNIIAKKNLEKITKFTYNHIKGNGASSTNKIHPYNNLSRIFLYEPGKTKLINLLNLAPPQVLASLNCGDRVTIKAKKHSISITTEEGIYLGALPDDLAHRLIALIDGDNKYEAYIKCATTKMLTIFIREVARSPKFANQPSFQSSLKHYLEEENQYF